jgi:glutamine amidotransferase
MCRLYGFRANEPTKVECSLVHAQNALLLQSRSDMAGRSHADGWGIASYHEGLVVVEHRESAAFEDLHFGSTAERIYATTVVAHVRRATVGGASKANTHPFRYGRWTFAHNGTIAAFDIVGEELARATAADLQRHRAGSTDSEQAFYWLLSLMEEDGIDLEHASPEVDRLAEIVGKAVSWLDLKTDEASGKPQASKLNFVITNGEVLVATRLRNSLNLLERDGIRDCEICGIPHVEHEPGHRYRAVAVASEPITHEEWYDVPDGHLVAIDAELRVEILSLSSF